MHLNKTLAFIFVIFFLALPMIMAGKQCVSGSTYINIISPNEYGVGKSIGNITLSIDKNTFTCGSSSATISLYEGTTLVEKLENRNFNTNCQISNLAFGYLSPRSGNYRVEVSVRFGIQEFRTIKDISILPAINTKLTCSPIPAYVNREIKCSWSSTRAGSTELIGTTARNVLVTQGTTEISYNSAGANTISFLTQAIGGIKVSLKTAKDGYVSDSDSFIVDVEGLTISNDFSVDNKDYRLYSSGFDTGTKTFEMKVKESGVLVDVAKVDAKIITPTFQEVPIIFNNYDTGIYRAVFNLESPGQTYSLKGNIIFSGDQESVPFEYSLSTVQTSTGSQSNLYMGIIVAIGGTVVVIIVVVIIVLVKRRR